MTIYCPGDTRQLLDPSNTGKIARRNWISNFALRFQHFLETKNDDDGKFLIGAEDLGESQEVIEHLRKRQTDQLHHLAQNNEVFCEFYVVDWRLVIGLGGGHVQETSMTLDHIYGVPFVPSTAVKGVVRSWAIDQLFGDFEICEREAVARREIQEEADSEELKQKKRDFFAVFGSQEQAGQVHFLPAYPTKNSVTFAVDIMNPHFPDYYTGSDPPTDDQNPIPINFLTLEQTPFRFVLMSKEKIFLDLAKNWLDGALKNKGLGAKTAVGYGYFGTLGQVPRTLRIDPNYQIPIRERKPKLHKHSLDEASEIYESQPSIPIDVEPIKQYAAQLAIVATRDDFVELGQLPGIDPRLVEIDGDFAMISDFGAWVWQHVKSEVFATRILALPRLIYATAFRKDLKKLSDDELVEVQEKLLQISNQLETSGGDPNSADIGAAFQYITDAQHGTITLLRYVKGQ